MPAHEKKYNLAFNRGVLSKLGLARIDIERYGMSAEIQENYVPRVLGPMMLRPGLEFIDFMREDLNLTRQLPFIFSEDDTALLEMNTDTFMRIRINDELLTRETVATTVTNPSFATNLTGWTVVVAGSSTVTQSGGAAVFFSDGDNFAKLRQTVTVAVGDQGTEHALRINCGHFIRLRVGSTVGGDEYVSETILGDGQHSIAFTPTGNFTIELASDRGYDVEVLDCDVESSGTVELTHPINSEAKMRAMRWDQSGDVIYVAAGRDTRPFKIERRGGGRSWSVVDYQPEDGPFGLLNTGAVTLTPSALSGDITLTASEPIFTNQDNFDMPLFALESNGQNVSEAIAAADVFTNPIRVSGNGNARLFGISITGTFTATVTLQFAFDPDGPWTDVTDYTAATSTSYDDEQDGAIIYYRIGIKTGNYTSGTATCALSYSSGSIRGIVQVYNEVSSTVADARVLTPLGDDGATKFWQKWSWSDGNFPTAVRIHEGRLFWAGSDQVWGSISDAYESFDEEFEGDAGPIQRTIGTGPIATIHWLLSLQRLMMGTADMSTDVDAGIINGNSPLGVRSSSFDEPLTPSNFNIKPVASKGLFVDRTKQRLYELAWDSAGLEYQPLDLSIFTPDFNEVGIVQIAVQHKPDVRVHCVRSDGTVGMLVYDRAENVICWVDIISDPSGVGSDHCVEDVAVLPGTVEDQVYYTVKRFNSAVSGGNQGEERHLEKWALESEAVGGTVNKQADSFTHYSGAAISTLTGLNHLAGFTCVVWADGADRGTVTVGTTGTFDADLSGLTGAPFSEIVIGHPYTARFKSTKLASIVRGEAGISLNERKKVNRISMILQNTHYQGIEYGPDFDNMNPLPLVEGGQVTPDDTVWAEYDKDSFAFGGEWNTDSRVCLRSAAPRPATIMSAIVDIESVES